MTATGGMTPAQTTAPLTPVGSEDGTMQQVKETAAEGISAAKNTVAEGATAAKDKAAEGLSVAKDKALSAADDKKSQLVSKGTEGLDEADKIASRLREDGMAKPAEMIEKVADEVRGLVDYLDRTPADVLLRDVSRMARRSPIAFGAGAFALGFAAVRLIKSGTDDTTVPHPVAYSAPVSTWEPAIATPVATPQPVASSPAATGATWTPAGAAR